MPGDNTPGNKSTVLCEKHWPENYPTKVNFGKEIARDPPSVFTRVKPSQVSTLPPRKRITVKALAEEARNLLPGKSDHILEKDKIKDFSFEGMLQTVVDMKLYCSLKNICKKHL